MVRMLNEKLGVNVISLLVESLGRNDSKKNLMPRTKLRKTSCAFEKSTRKLPQMIMNIQTKR